MATDVRIEAPETINLLGGDRFKFERMRALVHPAAALRTCENAERRELCKRVFQTGIVADILFTKYGEAGMWQSRRRIIPMHGTHKTVRFAIGGDAKDLNIHIQIPGHFSDHGKLLIVLFTKYGDMGLCQIKKFGNHCGHTVKMARP